MKIFIASDHAGFKLKQSIVKKNKDFVDLTKKFTDSDDYPLITENLCKKINKNSKGILICGSGIGVSIAANKFKNIRAALCFTQKQAELSRKDEDSNILCLSGWFLTTEKALKIIKKWLSCKFSSEPRHLRRLNQIKNFEKWR